MEVVDIAIKLTPDVAIAEVVPPVAKITLFKSPASFHFFSCFIAPLLFMMCVVISF